MKKAPSPSPTSPRPSRTASLTTADARPPNTTARPSLQRLPRSHFASPGRTTDKTSRAPTPPTDRDDDETTDTDTSEAPADEHVQSNKLPRAAENATSGEAPQAQTSPDEKEIERLRKLQLKILQQQQQQQQQQRGARIKTPSSAVASGTVGGRRVSPIKEEPVSSISPTLENAFSSPLATELTMSTGSTESAKTIRGSVPPTPAGHRIRTPSYPFPTVPNTPRTWSSAFHQPFTNLSPTVSALYSRDYALPKERIASETSTPAASTTPFAPDGKSRQSPGAEDPRFPSPNLYDLVLLLGSEPGLQAWWNTVTTIMCDWYGAERATLAVPADASDIENVPWGQKTTFNASTQHASPRGLSHHDAKSASQRDPDHTQSAQDTAAADAPAGSAMFEKRPKLPLRHSFPGPERHKKDTQDSPTPLLSSRPRGPPRALSHAPQSALRPEHPLRQVSQVSFDGMPQLHDAPISVREHTFSDPDFSSIGGDASPPTGVFTVLRALDHEPDALIDNTGINRVLERGRLVTLTRDYSTSLSGSRRNSVDLQKEEQSKGTVKHDAVGQDPTKNQNPKGFPGLSSKSGKMEPENSRLHLGYEEYEQFPSSPWAQSPAPSPAIQNDPTENPFFATGNIVEESFNPSKSTQDYTQFGQVEAIGVDRASTVTHIPLVHPTLSQVMQPTDIETPSQTPSLSRRTSEQSGQGSTPKEAYQRRAPIAILSVLSPIVPYPRNLTNSLKHLGPHLATSFSNAWQFTNAQSQATGVRQGRFMTGQQVGFTAGSRQESLDDLLHLDLENISASGAGSVTSPSDYSGRSKHSPGGSISGTPGWDPSNMGLSSKHGISTTPSHLTGSEAIESYFDAKKRTTRASAQSGSTTQEQSSRKPEKRALKRTTVNVSAEGGQEDFVTSGVDKPHPNYQQRHSFLHSYGADFSSSFQSLPAATTPGVHTPATPGASRNRSLTETHDSSMPPPSESLLRTIIDSLPVQIFTARPTTGALTWANSKFLVYRGQESHQVLQGPWDAIHPDDRDLYLEQWNKCLRTGNQLQMKVRLQRFDGHYRWFYIRAAPLRTRRLQIVHWIGTNMDIHEQHMAELNSARQQETAASEAKYRALANSSPQVVFVVSNRRGLTFCNSQWITFSGQSETQALGTGFLEHVHPDDVIKCKLPEMSEDGSAATNVPTSLPTEQKRQDSTSSEDSSETEKAVTSPGSSASGLDMPQAKLSKLASTGILRVTKDAYGRASYSTEVRLCSKDGEFRWHLVRILLEKSLAEDNDEETWYGTATDINDHKLLEQTLKETMEAKSKFLSNMSHEIRTPLNGISGMVNFLLDSSLNPEQLEHVNIIKASTDSLLNLINDILDLSKVEAGMIKLTMEWLHLPSLLEEVNDLSMGLAIQKGLELNYLMDEGVPSMVKGDKFRIRQVLLNVVGNAIKFTQKGEIFVRCRLHTPERTGSLNDSETMVRFEVIDTGRGFNENEAKHLFKRFSQIDASSTRQHGGTGLGLAISMQFVELHGGKMDARSIPDKGSTFFFTIKFGLPSKDDQPKPPIATPRTPLMEPSPSGPPMPAPPVLQKPVLQQVAANARFERYSSMGSEHSDSIKSPVPSLTTSERSRESPSLSSGSSDHSLTSTALTGRSSLRSERSSASSYLRETNATRESHIDLALPSKRIDSDQESPSVTSSVSLQSNETIRPPESQNASPLGNALSPPMYSILVVCPLIHSREATIRHIKNTLPQGIPHQITGQPNLVEAQRMIGGDDPVLFTHVVLVLHETAEVIAIMHQILTSTVHSNASIVVVSDPAQKKELMKEALAYDYDQLYMDRRLQFIYRPLKPSKFAVIFDPRKERESSTDRNQDSAQQVVVSQKLVFEELKRRLGGKGHKVLLVEDNHINQTVVLKFLAKISVQTETVLDGVQCTDKVFSKPSGYYSIILCDLHMPNKDGYQACTEIRRWEKNNGYKRIPIIALSANVLGDVYAKCVEAGFNSYVTKPVEFKELSLVMTKFLDPPDKTKQPELMKFRKG